MTAMTAGNVIRENYANPRYVSQEMFNIHLQGIKDRAALEERATDSRFERLEAVMDKNFSEIRSEMKGIRGEIKDIRGEIQDIRGEMKDMRGEIKDIQGEIQDIRGEMKDMRGEINGIRGEIRIMNERIEKNLANYEVITGRIEGDVKALSASVQALQQRRSWDIAWIGIAVAIGTALIQIFSK